MFLSHSSLYAQSPLNADSIKADSLRQLARSTAFSDPDLSMTYSEQLIALGTSSGGKEYSALGHYLKGIAFYAKGFYTAAIKSYLNSLELAESIKDTTMMGNTHMVLGIVYYQLRDFRKTEYHYAAAALQYGVLDSLRELSGLENNLGLVQIELKKYDEARVHFKEALKILGEIRADTAQNATQYANIYQSIGLTYSHLGVYDTALIWFRKAEEARKNVDEKLALARLYSDISTAHLNLTHYPEALKYGEQSLQLSTEAQHWEAIEEANSVLSEYYMARGDIDRAMKYHLAADVAKDSSLAAQNLSEIARMETQFDYEKRIERDSVLNAEQAKVTSAELKAKKNQQIGLAVVLVLVVVFAGVMYNRFRITKKQKVIIEEQKKLVDEKQKEVTDSINYAKRIQHAVLPPDDYFKRHLPASFVLYKPKDIVAGDFYWMEVIGETIMFAACDCTGHGVPGALVSMICNNALNRAVREFRLVEPSDILGTVREIVLQEFEKSSEDVKDGMDISLCSYNVKSGVLRWAGANNPLWIVRGGEVLEVKADKQPIGKHIAPRPFTTHQISLSSGDMLYIFTDGFQDQFGGPKGKKFKAGSLRELFLRIADQSPVQQKTVIDTTFEDWRSFKDADGKIHHYEQVDDVCVIGVRI